jgi:hypothetical protein
LSVWTANALYPRCPSGDRAFLLLGEQALTKVRLRDDDAVDDGDDAIERDLRATGPTGRGKAAARAASPSAAGRAATRESARAARGSRETEWHILKVPAARPRVGPPLVA